MRPDVHIVRAERGRHLPTERTDAHLVLVFSFPHFSLIRRQMNLNVQVQIRPRFEPFRTHRAHVLPDVQMGAVMLAKFALFGEALAALITNVREILAVNVLHVNLEATCRRVFAFALLTLEVPLTGVLTFVFLKAGVPDERFRTKATLEPTVSVGRSHVGVHQLGLRELLAARVTHA